MIKKQEDTAVLSQIKQSLPSVSVSRIAEGRTEIYTVRNLQGDFLGSVHQSLLDEKWLINPMGGHHDTPRYAEFSAAVQDVASLGSSYMH